MTAWRSMMLALAINAVIWMMIILAIYLFLK